MTLPSVLPSTCTSNGQSMSRAGWPGRGAAAAVPWPVRAAVRACVSVLYCEVELCKLLSFVCQCVMAWPLTVT